MRKSLEDKISKGSLKFKIISFFEIYIPYLFTTIVAVLREVLNSSSNIELYCKSN